MQQESTILLRSHNEAIWNAAKYCVFDVPDNNANIETRLEQMNKLKEKYGENSFIKIIDFVQCRGNFSLWKLLIF